MVKARVEANRKAGVESCGIDVTTDKRCNLKTTLHHGFCQLNPDTNRCAFRTNPRSPNKTKYTLDSIRSQLDETRTKPASTETLEEPSETEEVDQSGLHTFTPLELRDLMQLLNIEDDADIDPFTQIRNHLAGKFCRCVDSIRERQNGRPTDYPPQQTCRYSIFNRRGLASHRISCWDVVDGKPVYNPQLKPSKRSSVVLSKGPSWSPVATQSSSARKHRT
jgi:hypothetical protein